MPGCFRSDAPERAEVFDVSLSSVLLLSSHGLITPLGKLNDIRGPLVRLPWLSDDPAGPGDLVLRQTLCLVGCGVNTPDWLDSTSYRGIAFSACQNTNERLWSSSERLCNPLWTSHGESTHGCSAQPVTPC
jgi:hypothetical protein